MTTIDPEKGYIMFSVLGTKRYLPDTAENLALVRRLQSTDVYAVAPDANPSELVGQPLIENVVPTYGQAIIDAHAPTVWVISGGSVAIRPNTVWTLEDRGVYKIKL